MLEYCCMTRFCISSTSPDGVDKQETTFYRICCFDFCEGNLVRDVT